MSELTVHIRHCLLNDWELGHNANETNNNFVEIHGQNVLNRYTCYNWFKHFQKGDQSLEDEPPSGGHKKLFPMLSWLSSLRTSKWERMIWQCYLSVIISLRKIPSMNFPPGVNWVDEFPTNFVLTNFNTSEQLQFPFAVLPNEGLSSANHHGWWEVCTVC